MGHFVGKYLQQYFVHEGKVYNAPGGQELNLDPETLEPLVKTPLVTESSVAVSSAGWTCEVCGKVNHDKRGKFFHMRTHQKDN